MMDKSSVTCCVNCARVQSQCRIFRQSAPQSINAGAYMRHDKRAKHENAAYGNNGDSLLAQSYERCEKTTENIRLLG